MRNADDAYQLAKEEEVAERADARLAAKRERAATKIEELAPHARLLLGMLDETKVDLLLIAIGGAHLPGGD